MPKMTVRSGGSVRSADISSISLGQLHSKRLADVRDVKALRSRSWLGNSVIQILQQVAQNCAILQRKISQTIEATMKSKSPRVRCARYTSN
jgi:hypothetical protein